MRKCPILRPRYSLVLLLLFAGLLPAQNGTRKLTILHFNDFHAQLTPDDRQQGGLAELATAIRRERENCNYCIVLSAGDVVQGSPVSTIFQGVPVYELVNPLGVDAGTLGNHEFDYGWQFITKFLHKAKYPIVDANVTNAEGKLLTRKPYVILKVNGLRVGIIGALTEEMPSLANPDKLGPWKAHNVVSSVRKLLPEVQGRSDIVVLLAHVVSKEEDQILHHLTEVPVTVSGHTHTGIPAPKSEDGRIVVRVVSSSRELGRLDMNVDVAAKKIVSSEWKRIRVGPQTDKPAPDVAKRVRSWEGKVSKKVDVAIGEAKRTYAGADLKQLIEKATAEMMGTDFAFTGRGGIRAPLPAGRILARHVWNIYPFDNKVVVGRFKGKQLPPSVTHGAAVDPEKEYTVATNDFSAAHQKSPTELGTKGLEFPTEGPLQRDLLIDWVKKHKVIE